MRESVPKPAPGRTRLGSGHLGRNVGLGFALSVAVHLGAGAMLGHESSMTDALDDPLAAAERDRADPLRLGIDHSSAATINWVGFETPTDHAASKSSVEQAAVTPVVGTSRVASEDQPSPKSEPQPQETPVEPVTEAAAQPVDQQAAETVAQAQETAPVIPMDVFEPTPSVPAFKPDPLFSARPEPELNPLPAVVPEPKKPDDQPPVKKPTTEVSKPEPPKPKPTTKPVKAAPAKEAARPADPSGTRGIKDRREADASSKVQALTYRPGRPVAGEGLEIATVRPRFSVTIQVIARPRNPVVRIQFGRDGKVRRAEFVKKKGKILNTGSVHIDGPLMDAIYRWTAKGVALEPLKKDETLPVEIRLLLNGS